MKIPILAFGAFALLAPVPVFADSAPLAPASFSAPAKLIRPSVVNISTEQNIQAQPFNLQGNDPLFEYFHRSFGFPKHFTQHSLGSGVIVDAQRSEEHTSE